MTDKRIPASRIRAAWLDTSMPTAAAAATIGLSRAGLQSRARALGLPPRKSGRRSKVREAEFRILWAAGVTLAEIGRYFGCDPLTVAQNRVRLGMPKRYGGGKQRAVTLNAALADMQWSLLAGQMRTAANAEQRQMIIAGMADVVGHRQVGATVAA